MTYQEARKYAAKAGVKILAVVSVSSDDEICVEVKKGDFIEALSGWTGEANKIQLYPDGDLLIG